MPGPVEVGQSEDKQSGRALLGRPSAFLARGSVRLGRLVGVADLRAFTGQCGRQTLVVVALGARQQLAVGI